MKKIILLALLVSVFAPVVSAKVKKTKVSSLKTTASNVVVEKSKSSRAYRDEKNVSITAGLGFVLSEFGEFVNVELLTTRDLIVGLKLSYAGDDDHYYSSSSDNYDDWHEEETMFAVSVELKQFVTNTFYLKGGMFYRNEKEERNYDSIFSDSRTYRLEDAGILFSVGNQWQFSYLTLGCDWFGIGKSVYTFREDGYDYWDSDEIVLTITNFYLGVSF